MNPEKAIENHREILLRFTPLQKGGWFYFIVFSIVLAIAASWELLEWWGGRDLTAMLPKLFLNHFNDTSFCGRKQRPDDRFSNWVFITFS